MPGARTLLLAVGVALVAMQAGSAYDVQQQQQQQQLPNEDKVLRLQEPFRTLVLALSSLLGGLGVHVSVIIACALKYLVLLLHAIGVTLGKTQELSGPISELNTTFEQIRVTSPHEVQGILSLLLTKIEELLRCILHAVDGLLTGLLNPYSGGGGYHGGHHGGFLGGLLGRVKMARACSLLLVLWVSLAALQVASADEAQQHQLPFEGLVIHSLYGHMRTMVLGMAYFFIKFGVDDSLNIALSIALVRRVLEVAGPILDKVTDFEDPIKDLQLISAKISAKSSEEVRRKVRQIDNVLPLLIRCAGSTVDRAIPGVLPVGLLPAMELGGRMPIELGTDKLL